MRPERTLRVLRQMDDQHLRHQERLDVPAQASVNCLMQQ